MHSNNNYYSDQFYATSNQINAMFAQQEIILSLDRQQLSLEILNTDELKALQTLVISALSRPAIQAKLITVIFSGVIEPEL